MELLPTRVLGAGALGAEWMAVLLKRVRRRGPPQIWELLFAQGMEQVEGSVRTEREGREGAQ